MLLVRGVRVIAQVRGEALVLGGDELALPAHHLCHERRPLAVRERLLLSDVVHAADRALVRRGEHDRVRDVREVCARSAERPRALGHEDGGADLGHPLPFRVEPALGVALAVDHPQAHDRARDSGRAEDRALDEDLVVRVEPGRPLPDAGRRVVAIGIEVLAKRRVLRQR